MLWIGVNIFLGLIILSKSVEVGLKAIARELNEVAASIRSKK